MIKEFKGEKTMTQKVKIGSQSEVMNPNEIVNKVVAKNSRVTLNTATGGTTLNYSYTGGIAPSIYENANPDWVQIVNLIETYMVRLFQWEGIEEDFRGEMEHLLFRHGKVAIIKLPNGDIYPTHFSHNREDEDFYGNPKEITIHTRNKFNGMRFKDKDFVILWNNHKKTGTLTFLYERLRQTVKSLRDVDNNSLLSAPKWGVNITADDNAFIDVIDAMHSSASIIPFGNINFREMGVENLSGEDRADSMIETFRFQLSTLLKMIGLRVNNGTVKAERQTKEEILTNDEFDGFILDDMFKVREDKITALNELGLQISIVENENIAQDLEEEATENEKEIEDNE